MHLTEARLPSLPLVGRAAELERLHDLLDRAAAGSGGAVLLCGQGGVGKTRLARAAVDEAERRGWQVALGRAYPVETGVPYAVVADALLPLLRRFDRDVLRTLSRGTDAELAYLFPTLGDEPLSDRVHLAGQVDVKARVLWSLSQLLGRIASRSPLLIGFEDLQWADASSIELIHFLVRQIGGLPILVVATLNDGAPDASARLRSLEPSFHALDGGSVQRVQPLDLPATFELVQKAFGVDEAVIREFGTLLYGWTRGNPFFIEETLKELVDSGRLRQDDGRWVGWEVERLDLPVTVREAIVSRVGRLSANARTVAELAAVLGVRIDYGALAAVNAGSPDTLLAGLDELRAEKILVEAVEDGTLYYDFTHPLLRETLYAELGHARVLLLHRTVAEALEQRYGTAAAEHADELAYHFVRAEGAGLAGKAVRYLALAGRRALARSANREAANYLAPALERWESAGGESVTGMQRTALAEDLAQARQRLGEYDSALELWSQALADAEAAGDAGRAARLRRRMGLACYWSGRHADALTHYAAGLEAAARGGDDSLAARLHIARGTCFQELGDSQEAEHEIGRALQIAGSLNDDALLARAYRALLLHHTWMGPPETARRYAERALELARGSGDRAAEWSTHWALAMLEGFTGNQASAERHLGESERLADELGSPLLRLWTAEVAVELASGMGDWERGLDLAERTIALARALKQRMLLPRLLVWAGIMYLRRGELERGKAYVDEAWQLSGADRGRAAGPLDVHVVVPAHTGRAAYHLAVAEYEEAVRVAEAGIHIADRSGYVIWAIHRLMPTLVEAYLWLDDTKGAVRIGRRLRKEAARLDHRLGLAWADGCDALLRWLSGDPEGAVGMLRNAAEELEAIPIVPDAARLRRQLAGRLAEIGQREEALKELRRVHDVFTRLGAGPELEKTRNMFRQLGARPPSRSAGAGPAGLTAREQEIVRLVLTRKTNKSIARTLGISPRTASTHVSNVFRKLGVRSRAELADYVRRSGPGLA